MLAALSAPARPYLLFRDGYCLQRILVLPQEAPPLVHIGRGPACEVAPALGHGGLPPARDPRARGRPLDARRRRALAQRIVRERTSRARPQAPRERRTLSPSGGRGCSTCRASEAHARPNGHHPSKEHLRAAAALGRPRARPARAVPAAAGRIRSRARASNREIAEALFVSVDTVKSHLQALSSASGSAPSCRRTASAGSSPAGRSSPARSRTDAQAAPESAAEQQAPGIRRGLKQPLRPDGALAHADDATPRHKQRARRSGPSRRSGLRPAFRRTTTAAAAGSRVRLRGGGQRLRVEGTVAAPPRSGARRESAASRQSPPGASTRSPARGGGGDPARHRELGGVALGARGGRASLGVGVPATPGCRRRVGRPRQGPGAAARPRGGAAWRAGLPSRRPARRPASPKSSRHSGRPSPVRS